MDLTLDALLNQIRGDMQKSAAEGEDKEDKKDDEKKEDKSDDKDEKKLPPWMKDKGDSKDEKSEDKDEKSEDKGEEKKASAELTPAELGAALAREVMEKTAATINKNQEPEMNKQAQTAGQALASALLENLQKKASAGDMTVMDGGPAAGAVPTKVQADVQVAMAEGGNSIKPMLTGNGIENSGTINEIFDAMIQDAIAQGAASEEQVHGTGYSAPEGNAESGVPSQVKTASELEQDAQDEIEKAAAVEHLVAQGVDFSDAVELVKQAAVEIEFEMEKAAAMTALMAEGVNFDDAIELVKQASAGDMTVPNGGAAPGAVANKVQNDVVVAEAEGAKAVKFMPTGNGLENAGTINQIFDGIVQDAMAQGAASESQVHATGYAGPEGNAESGVPSQVKVAAIERMVEAGIDFEDAVEFVKEAGAQAAAEAVARGVGKAVGSVSGFAGAAGKAVGGQGAKAARAVKGAAQRGAGAVAGSNVVQNVRQYAEHVVKPHAQNAATLAKGVIAPTKTFGKETVGDSPMMARLAAGKMLAKNPVAQGVAGAAAVGGAGAYAASRNREKKAAFDALVEAGVDFDEAAILVSQKAIELYGE